MKPVIIFITLLLVGISAIAQISPALKTGVGYPFSLDNDQSIAPDVHTISSYPTVMVEKPIPIEIRFKNRLSINPGLAYYFFKENEVKGNTDKGKDFKFNHQTLNSYVKVLYQQKLVQNSEGFLYFGPVGGFHLITKTKGTKITYGLNQETPVVEVAVNENGKDFFGMLYYGGLIGFQPNVRKYNEIKLSFELAYVPSFVTKEVEGVKTDVDFIQFTVMLGFRGH